MPKNNDHPKRNIKKIRDLNFSKKMHGFTASHLAQFTIHNILKKHLKLNAHWIPRGRRGSTLIFSYTCIQRLGLFQEIQNFGFQYLFIYFIIIIYSFYFLGGGVRGGGGWQKIESSWRMQIWWILFGGHHKTGLFWGFIFMHLQVFF